MCSPDGGGTVSCTAGNEFTYTITGYLNPYSTKNLYGTSISVAT
jgi:hypothetical protein